MPEAAKTMGGKALVLRRTLVAKGNGVTDANSEKLQKPSTADYY